MALGLTAIYEMWSHYAVVRVGTKGALAAAVAVTVMTGVSLIRLHWRTREQSKARRLRGRRVRGGPVPARRQQLNVSIVVTRSTPGPAGLYVVSANYFVDGVRGAVAGSGLWSHRLSSPWSCCGSWAAERNILGSKGRPRAWSSPAPRCCGSPPYRLGREAITDPVLAAILILGAAVLATRKVESIWVILGSAGVYLAAASLRVVGL